MGQRKHQKEGHARGSDGPATRSTGGQRRQARRAIRRIDELQRKIDETLKENAEEFAKSYVQRADVERVGDDDRIERDSGKHRTEITRLIRGEEYPVVALRIECMRLYLGGLANLLPAFDQTIKRFHEQVADEERFAVIREARPEYLILKTTSGSPMLMIGIIMFLMPLLGDGSVQSVSSDLVAAYVKEFLDGLRSIVGMGRDVRPHNPMSEMVEMVERAITLIGEGQSAELEVASESFDPQSGKLVARSRVTIRTGEGPITHGVVGDLRRKVLHAEDCPMTAVINAEDKIEVSDVKGASRWRLKPHRVCLRKLVDATTASATVKRTARERSGQK